MDRMTIGYIHTNGVDGIMGIGYTCIGSSPSQSKSSTGFGSIKGDGGRMLTLTATVYDSDLFDSVSIATPPRS